MRRAPGSGSLYHVTNVKMTDDGGVSAGGLSFSLHRPTHVNRVRVTFTYERTSETAPTNNQSLTCTVSIGLYTPIHAEAVAWSPTHILNLYQKTIINIRPRGSIWGHYGKDDKVIILTVRGRDVDFTILAIVEAWVSYGPPDQPGVTLSTAHARLLPELAPLHNHVEILSNNGRDGQTAGSVNGENISEIGSEMSLV